MLTQLPADFKSMFGSHLQLQDLGCRNLVQLATMMEDDCHIVFGGRPDMHR